MPVIYPIDIVQKHGAGGFDSFQIAPVLSLNNGHRSCPAWAVPESEVPLVCSKEEWEQIREREYRRLCVPVSYWNDREKKIEHDLLRPINRDSSLNKGYVRETRTNGWCERRLSTCVSGGCYIRVLPRFPDFETGELLKPYIRIKECDWDGENLLYNEKCVHFMRSASSRADNIRQVKATCNKFMWKVRANEHLVRLFLTLTYAENMKDTKRLYEDFRRFFARLKRAFPDISGYLAACEPQKRGAWHMHVLLLSRKKSLYISNKRVCSLWGRGFTKTQRVRHVRDVGVYLSSYLSNIKDGKGTKKGARLYLYPCGFRFTRWSRSTESPEITKFYGGFGDSFRDLLEFELCYDYQNEKKKDGLLIKSRVSLFYREKPK